MIQTRIKDLREDNDITQKEIAEKLNIPRTTYSQYELSKRDVPYEIMKELAEFYNTSIDYLVYLTDEIKPYKRRK